MAIKKLNLGKSVATKSGYNVRIILESKQTENIDRNGKLVKKSKYCDSGKLGVYAGKKKLIKADFKTINEALFYINDLKISKK